MTELEQAVDVAAASDRLLRTRGALMSTLGCAALVLIVIAGASSSPVRLWTAPDTTEVSPTVREVPVVVPPAELTQPDDGARWLPNFGPVLGLAAMLVVLAIIGFGAFLVLALFTRGSGLAVFVRRRRRRPSFDEVLPSDQRPVEVDERAAVVALQTGAPRNAIVRCWIVLERDAAAAGIQRAASETSSEYVERVVGQSSIDPRPIAELASLYREARFSSNVMSETSRARAQSALSGILDNLHRNVTASP